MVATVMVNAVAAVSVTLAALVKVGTLLTVRTNAWLVFPDELVAKKLIE